MIDWLKSWSDTLAPVATLSAAPETTSTGPPILESPKPRESEPLTIFKPVSEFVVRLCTASLLVGTGGVIIPADVKLITASSEAPGT